MTNEIEIDEDGEMADVLVCARLTKPLMMPDNQIALCAQCGEAIQHRPHVPRLPRKLCAECARPQIEANAAKGELVTVVTPETIADLRRYFRKKNAN